MTNNSVLLLFTGGTISMAEDPQTGALRPIEFDKLLQFIPELERLEIHTISMPFLPFIDSSDIDPQLWIKIAKLIYENYDKYDGFVILHGTDTMAFSASALSFMLENLSKPVIFTGSQLPINILRSDAKENLLTAIEIASAKEKELALVPEVCIFFENKLYRANRTTKQNAEHFNAFASFNYPALAEAGVHLKYYKPYIQYPKTNAAFAIKTAIDCNIAILKLYPGISEQIVKSIFRIENLKAIILETYGAGNAPQANWFLELLNEAKQNNIIVVNKTQCSIGTVEMGRYETSLNLLKAGVISSFDATTEAVLTKLMCLLGEYQDIEIVREKFVQNICGEITN